MNDLLVLVLFVAGVIAILSPPGRRQTAALDTAVALTVLCFALALAAR